jgi:hypothetical protein
MNKIILAVGADDNYLHNVHFNNYLNSINEFSNFDENILVYLGHQNIQTNNNKIKIFNLNPDSIIKKNPNNCVQHGEFLKSSGFENFSDNDIIVFTDGDMALQRELSVDEINFLRNLNDNDVYVGYNQSPEDTLENEYFRLQPRLTEIPSNLKINNIKVYNTGVLCMNKKTWNKLCNSYIEKYDEVNNLFGHYAKQQWLICYILGDENYNIIEMGYDIHNHTHYPSPIGTSVENGYVMYNNKVVLFKHRWF